MIERIPKFIVRDNVKALMSVGEAWKRAFNDRERQVQSLYKARNDKLEAVSDGRRVDTEEL